MQLAVPTLRFGITSALLRQLLVGRSRPRSHPMSPLSSGDFFLIVDLRKQQHDSLFSGRRSRHQTGLPTCLPRMCDFTRNFKTQAGGRGDISRKTYQNLKNYTETMVAIYAFSGREQALRHTHSSFLDLELFASFTTSTFSPIWAGFASSSLQCRLSYDRKPRKLPASFSLCPCWVRVFFSGFLVYGFWDGVGGGGARDDPSR